MKTAILLFVAAATATAGDTRDDVARKLDARVSLDLQGVRLGEALQIFRDLCGINIVVADGSEVLARLTVRDVSAKSALRLLLHPLGLGAVFENGAVVVRSRQALESTMTTRIYDVRSAMRKLEDFPAPDFVLRPALLFFCTLGVEGDRAVACQFGEVLEILVREHTGDGSWDKNPRASVVLANGLLHVTQTPRVHREIESFLTLLHF